VRIIDRARRERLAILFTILAIGAGIGGVLAGALAHVPAAGIFPAAGLVAYGFLSSRAVVLWQGRRALPRPPRQSRRIVVAPPVPARERRVASAGR
jgi:hypothetical protein